MHQDRFRVHLSMTCGECGNQIAPGEHGLECNRCGMWPLCNECQALHARLKTYPEHIEHIDGRTRHSRY